MINIRVSTEDDKQRAWWDNTKLVAFNTCPTWGAVSYVHNKRMHVGGRALALEAGQACHEVFAAVRLVDLLTNGPNFYEKIRGVPFVPEVVIEHAQRMFTVDRWKEVMDLLDGPNDIRTRLVRIAVYLLNTNGYYDDPKDRKRTITNMEEACIAYIDHYTLGRYIPVVHGNFIGVEVPIDVVIEYSGADARDPAYIDDFGTQRIRFVGKVDGVCWDSSGKIIEVHENKTASRLDDAWTSAFDVSHQVSGYCVALTAILSHIGAYDAYVQRAQMFGMTIPQPRAASYGGIIRHPVDRPHHMIDAWLKWVQHTVNMAGHSMQSGSLVDIPRYTHSCNRYFRACPLVPLCASNEEDAEALFSEMHTHVWDPLAEAKEAGD